nr:ABC transporter ATP-binding protein [Marinisporobacter balticus]
MKNAIEIKNVRKVYRVGDEKIVALNDVSLEIKTGEICCFLGTSGSGKSTLLNMMAGLEKPTRGIIKINEKNVEKMNEKQLAKFRQKHIGFVFQSYNLLAALTALENVSMPLTFRGMKKKQREKISAEILDAVGLKKYITHKPNQMSGGQQQRVGIARAFVSKPPIIFADEPTGNLDSKTTKEVMNLMLEIAKENNQTIIIVTHDRSIAEYADKVVYILDGNIEKIEEK